MIKHRSLLFFPDHWRGDVALRICSMAARGLWLEMLCEMHSAEPYGHLVTSTGVPIKVPDELATLVTAKVGDVRRWLAELEAAEVFSRTEAGVIYSRRMVRDAGARAEWRARQIRHRTGVPRQDDVAAPRDNRVTGFPSVTQMSRGKDKGKDITPPNGGGPPPELSRKSHGDEAPAWAAELEAAIAAIREVELRDLTAAQRAILGRYHAFAFGHSGHRDDDPGANKRKGAQLAGTFAKMAAAPEFFDLLVDEYLIAAQEFFLLQGGSPWLRPFDVKGVLPAEILSRGNGTVR